MSIAHLVTLQLFGHGLAVETSLLVTTRRELSVVFGKRDTLVMPQQT